MENNESAWQGVLLLVRDNWIIDGIAPVETLKEFQDERTRLEKEAEHNRKRYEGSWNVRFVRDGKLSEFSEYETALGFNG